jgi:hypothetical protein
MSAPVQAGDPNEREDLAQQMGRDGYPAPDWVKANVRNYAAWKRGMDSRSPAAFHPPPQPSRPARVRHAHTRPAGQPSSSADGPNYLDRAVSPSAAAQRVADATGASKVAAAGDGGGLLLAFVVYPIVLATIRYGAAGPGVWFRAKWLNQPTGAKNTAQPAAAGSPAPVRPIRPGVPS